MKFRLSAHSDWECLAKQAQFSPTQLAHKCGVSLRTLQRFFHRHYRLNIKQWLTQLRLNLAYHMLIGGQTVKEVTYELGYKQVSHFSREFKRFHGLPPSMLSQPPAPAKPSEELWLPQLAWMRADPQPMQAQPNAGRESLMLERISR